jgi:regulator of sirC expression with transglutaminase-like and TPR domain
MAAEGADTRQEAEAILARIGAGSDAEIDLTEGALALAALDRPQVPLDRYRAHLAELAQEVARQALAANARTAAEYGAAIARVLFERYGYEGDRLTYDDLQNANLMRVIDRRKGLPVALGILMIHAARAQDWSMVGLGFPAHFLVRLESGAERLILDPFAGGAVVDSAGLRVLLKEAGGEASEIKPSHYEPVSDRAVLLRLQNNLKMRLLRERQLEAAARVVMRMLMIAPQETELWREAGMIEAHLGNLKRAIALIESYRDKGSDRGQRRKAALLLQELAQRLH